MTQEVHVMHRRSFETVQHSFGRMENGGTEEVEAHDSDAFKRFQNLCSPAKRPLDRNWRLV
jgi:hypothetical protein